MPNSPDRSAGRQTQPRLSRNYEPRQGRKEGIPLYVQAYDEDQGRWTYVPSFPMVFNIKGQTYGKAWEVFNTHYLQKNKFGDGALMRFEHYGLWLHLQYMASHREQFYAGDLAANVGCTRHTIYRYLDHLENLQLIQRLRNSGWSNRFVSVLLHAPLPPTKLFQVGEELMWRVTSNVIDQERKAAGPGKWPAAVWDASTMASQLRGDAKTVERVGRVQDAISVVWRRISEPGYNDFGDPPFMDLVRQQCSEWRVTFNQRDYDTAMTWRRLNAKPRKEAPL